MTSTVTPRLSPPAASTSRRAIRLLELQGWRGPELDQAAAVGLWVRWSPALCLVTVVVGTALASPVILLGLALTALAGAALPFHPFDIIYNRGIRHLVGRPPLPPAPAARRSACAVAAVWLVGTALAFGTGATTAGYVLGTSLASAAAVFAFAGFCIPSFLLNMLVGRERACRTTLPAAFRRT